MARTENGQSGRRRGKRPRLADRAPGARGVPGFPGRRVRRGAPGLAGGGGAVAHPPSRRRGRRAPEAGGDFLCPPRPRPPGRCLRLPVAASAAASSDDEAKGGGEGQAAPGRAAPAAGQADGVSGAGPREPRLEGGTPGFPGGEWGRSPVGAGRRVSAASGSLPFPGVGPTDIPRPPLACLPVPVSAVRPCGFPPLSPSARYPLARFSSLAPAPVQGNLFLTSLPLLQPCLSWVL